MARRIRHQFLVLLVLQGGQNLCSLLLLPILARALGPQGYGEVGFCIAFIGYFVLFADWGFDLSASRQIAINHQNPKRQSKIFWTTLASRVMLGALGVFGLFLLIVLVPKLSTHAELLWIVCLIVIATILSTQFFYQGIESLEKYSLVNLVVRSASIPLIYFFVKQPDDVDIAVFIICFSHLFAAILNFAHLLFSKKIYWLPPSFLEVIQSIKDSFSVAVASSTTGIFSNSIVVVLGFSVNSINVGYFIGAYNLIRAGQGLLAPLAQVMFPRLNRLYADAPAEAIIALRKMFQFQSILTLTMMLLSLIAAPYALPLILGAKFSHSVLLFQLLSPLLFLGALSNIVGQQALIALGRYGAYTKIYVICSIVGLVAVACMASTFSVLGAALAVVATEALILMTLIQFLSKNYPEIFKILKIN